MTSPAVPTTRRTGGWLAGFALAVIIGHHVGTLAKPLGTTGGQTEWADWIDLLTPYAVVGTALVVLLRAGTDRTTWLLAALGAVVYVQGHGIHLAANSVGNARGSDQPVHLWDEVIGHYVWYGGLYLLLWALARAVDRVPRGGWGWPLAVLLGLTLTTNGIEGGTPYLTLAVVIAFAGWAVRRHDHVMTTAFAVAAVLLIGWGAYWQGFPQFSELGWI